MARSTAMAPAPGGVGSANAVRSAGAAGSGNGPVVVLIRVSENTRRGCAMARRCAIIPPKEAPTTWAPAWPKWSSNRTASSAMSASR